MSYGSDAFVRRCRQHLFAFSAQCPSLLLPTVSDRFILYSSMVHGGGFMGLHYPHGRSMLHAPGAALPRRTLAEARVYLLVLLMYGIIVNTVQIEHLIFIYSIYCIYVFILFITPKYLRYQKKMHEIWIMDGHHTVSPEVRRNQGPRIRFGSFLLHNAQCRNTSLTQHSGTDKPLPFPSR
jgi:hypothetical protein